MGKMQGLSVKGLDVNYSIIIMFEASVTEVIRSCYSYLKWSYQMMVFVAFKSG